MPEQRKKLLSRDGISLSCYTYIGEKKTNLKNQNKYIYIYIPYTNPALVSSTLHNLLFKTADGNPRCSRHVLKQRQHELRAIVGDGSEMTTIMPNT